MHSWILLLNIYTTFCQTFAQGRSFHLTWMNFFILLLTSRSTTDEERKAEKKISCMIDLSNLVLGIQLLLIYSLLNLCEKIHLRPNDAIAIVFCGSQKSLTTG